MAEQLAVRRVGSGPPLILVHGGAGPALTWELQEPLAERWTLIVPARRGYPPSPPAERQDFESDADDLTEILTREGSAHLVGFSYGAVSATIAAAWRPDQGGVHGRGRPRRVAQLAERARVERIARDLRFPGEAEPDAQAIAGANVPCLVVSGDHQPGLEALCDAVARRLRASRERVAGAGHAAQRAPGFNDRLERFLARAEAPHHGG